VVQTFIFSGGASEAEPAKVVYIVYSSSPERSGKQRAAEATKAEEKVQKKQKSRREGVAFTRSASVATMAALPPSPQCSSAPLIMAMCCGASIASG